MISVKVEGEGVSTFSSLDEVWGYLNGFFLSPVDALLFSIDGDAIEMGDLTWKALCGTPARLAMYLDWDEGA